MASRCLQRGVVISRVRLGHWKREGANQIAAGAPARPVRMVSRMAGNAVNQMSSFLIRGPAHTNKTTLLLQAAVENGQAGHRVDFISQVPINQLIGTKDNLSALMLDCLHFIHFKDHKELTAYLTCLHMNPNPPSVLLVHNLNNFMSKVDGDVEDTESNVSFILARTCALLIDTASFCGRDLCKSEGKIAVTWETGTPVIPDLLLSDLDEMFRILFQKVWKSERVDQDSVRFVPDIVRCDDKGEGIVARKGTSVVHQLGLFCPMIANRAVKCEGNGDESNLDRIA